MDEAAPGSERGEYTLALSEMTEWRLRKAEGGAEGGGLIVF